MNEGKEPKDACEVVCEFEKKHGSIPLLKAGMSAINKILVEKGVCTEAELKQEMFSQMKILEED